jgi:preprotein translocase subunit YajC
VRLEELSFLIVVIVMVAFYLIFIRPSQQEQKRHQQEIRDLSVGDDVITTAGFFATVRRITTPEEGPVEIMLDFGNGIEVRALTSSVLKRVSAAAEAAERSEGAQEA